MDWLIGHLIGDYLLQNDWMAQGKKKAHWPCFVHVALYTASVMLLSQWPLWAAAIVFIPHYAIDRWQFVPWWMDSIGQKTFRLALGPWSMIVVDNVMHLVCLYATEQLISLPIR